METKIKDRIVNYWTKRSENFAQLRQEELHSYMSELWLTEITKYLPQRPCKILDVGTGTGFFANLLAQYHHEVEGIDLTASMIEQAKQSLTKLQQHDYKINFQVMDAENLYFTDNTFDVVISRNLTWTLPNPQKAYSEWYRVLKPQGVLLNFDADYGNEQFYQTKIENLPLNHAHRQVKPTLMQECDLIKNSLEISSKIRPDWDLRILKQLQFKDVFADTNIGQRIYKHQDKFYNPAPVFLIYAQK